MARARRVDGRVLLDALEVLPTPAADFDAVVDRYLRDTGLHAPQSIAVAAAGRVRREAQRAWVALTNTPLRIERATLAARCAGGAWLLNDLAAVAAALPLLGEDQLQAFGPACAPAAGAQLVIGLGTGFGAAARTPEGGIVDTEAGHADLAAVSVAEHHWLARLAPQGRASVEQVLSGPGLLAWYRAMAPAGGGDMAALIDAWQAGQPAARELMRLFSTWLGRVAGNLVLSLGAWGGVSLIGGVVAGLGPMLDAQAFRHGLQDRVQFAADLAALPVQRILHPQPALLGLAGLALGAARS